MIDYSTGRTLGALLQDSVRESRRSLARLLALSLSLSLSSGHSFYETVLTTTKKEEKKRKERKTDWPSERENAQQRQQKKRNRKVSPATPSVSLYPRIVKGRNFFKWGVEGVGAGGTYLFYQIENNFGLQKVRSAQFPPLNFSLSQLWGIPWVLCPPGVMDEKLMGKSSMTPPSPSM
jgi:hypothetical protein